MAFWISLLESDADLVAATTDAGGPFLTAAAMTLHPILKSEPEIKNRCTQEDLNRENPAAIPKFTP